MKLHITPRQTVYPALAKLNAHQQNDLRNGVKSAVEKAFEKDLIGWNNDVTLDLDFRLCGKQDVTIMVNVLLNAEDGDLHCRIDHLMVHKDSKAAEAFAEARDKNKGSFKKVL